MSFFKKFNFFRNLKLRSIIIIPFAILILISIVTTGYITLKNGIDTATNLADEFTLEVSNRVRSEVLNKLSIPERINTQIQHNLNTGLLNLDDDVMLEKYYWSIINTYPEVSSSYIGYSGGGMLGAGFNKNLGGIYYVRTKGKNLGSMYKYRTNAVGEKIHQINVNKIYNASKRPWFIKAVERNQFTWSDIYLRFSYNTLAITAALPIYENKLKLKGVLGIDLDLSKIDKFLKSLNLSYSAYVFIIDDKGRLVGTSTDDPVYTKSKVKNKRILNVLTEACTFSCHIKKLVDRHGGIDKIRYNKVYTTVGKHGTEFLTRVSNVNNSSGVNFYVISLIPKNELFSSIYTNMTSTILICVIMIIIVILIGIAASKHIAGPIENLNRSARMFLEGGEFQVYPYEKRNDEVGELGVSFHKMSLRIKELISSLELKVKDRTNMLAKSNNQLQDVNTTKDKLMSILAHDLRNPFHEIGNYVSQILKHIKKNDTDNAIKSVNKIKRTSDSTYFLLETLLEWSTVQGKGITVNNKAINLSRIVDENIDLLKESAGAKDIELIVDSPIKTNIIGDYHMLSFVVRNLIYNAIKFTSENGIVKVTILVRKHRIELFVVDSGKGMTELEMSKLFTDDVNYSDHKKDKGLGFGIGFMLCKEFVEAHSGKISVESEVGVGSSFMVRLPLVK